MVDTDDTQREWEIGQETVTCNNKNYTSSLQSFKGTHTLSKKIEIRPGTKGR